jgi:hypothetical protein
VEERKVANPWVIRSRGRDPKVTWYLTWVVATCLVTFTTALVVAFALVSAQGMKFNVSGSGPAMGGSTGHYDISRSDQRSDAEGPNVSAAHLENRYSSYRRRRVGWPESFRRCFCCP